MIRGSNDLLAEYVTNSLVLNLEGEINEDDVSSRQGF